jgi:nucleotide-binding universal stress UspA family protein
MTKPILVGYDPHEADRAPVRFGVAAARFTGAPLIVGSAYEDPVALGQIGDSRLHDIEIETRQGLADLRAELQAEGVPVECRLLVGGQSAAAALHHAADSFGAGLLVVGSTDRGRVGRLMLGSTAERVIHGAPCPVAVVPCRWERGEGLQTLGVAFADTPEGHQALADGVALARRAGAKLRVLCAVHPRTFGKDAGSGSGTEGSTFDAVGADVDAMTQRVLREASADGLEVDVDVSAQDAADFLIAASERLDLLVCGSRGYGPQRAVLLGGVSRKLIAGAGCPVIVLARGVEGSLQALVVEAAAAQA